LRKSDSGWFLTPVKQTIKRFRMIEEGDVVVVGLSGGKDSNALLYILKIFQKHAPFDFSLHAVHVDLGWDADPTPLYRLTEQLEVPLQVEKTLISTIVFERRKEKNPCALCANLRRGAFHRAALRLKANKVALGHHLDDAIETFFMNLVFIGQMDTFKPAVYLDRTGLTQIRPLVEVPEKTLAPLAKREEWPIMENPCPVNDKTKRQEVAKMVEQFESLYPDFRQKCRNALVKSPFWKM